MLCTFHRTSQSVMKSELVSDDAASPTAAQRPRFDQKFFGRCWKENRKKEGELTAGRFCTRLGADSSFPTIAPAISTDKICESL
jgi:hypothetical protein